MPYSLNCSDAGPECPFAVTTTTEDELMQHVAADRVGCSPRYGADARDDRTGQGPDPHGLTYLRLLFAPLENSSAPAPLHRFGAHRADDDGCSGNEHLLRRRCPGGSVTRRSVHWHAQIGRRPPQLATRSARWCYGGDERGFAREAGDRAPGAGVHRGPRRARPRRHHGPPRAHPHHWASELAP